MAFNVYSLLAFFLCLISLGQALSIPEVIDEVATIPSLLTRSLERRQATCPAVWQEISSELKGTLKGCNRNARTALRFAFHDAGGYSSKTTPYGPASGGADGSLLLNDVEMARVSQQPMQDYRNFLRGVYDKYRPKGITAADLVQFAGAVGLKSCPGGPSIRVVSSTRTHPSKESLLTRLIGCRSQARQARPSRRPPSRPSRCQRQLRHDHGSVHRQGFVGYRSCRLDGSPHHQQGLRIAAAGYSLWW